MALCILHANIFVCSTRTMYNIFYLFREFRQTRSYKKNLLTYLVTKKIYISSEMWWLIGSAPDFWGRGPGIESGISHNDPDALQDHCDKVENLREERETYP